MTTLLFMGRPDHRETFRCRVYGCDGDDTDECRLAFVRSLAGDGVLDCPAYDDWVAALQGRGWLPEQPELEPNPDGPGRVGRWRITAKGRSDLEALGLLSE